MKEEKFLFFAVILCIIITIIYIFQLLYPSLTGDFLLNSSLLASRPWTIVTAIFLHGSTTHLLSNLFALGIFGLLLERIIGSKKFLVIFFATGIVANIFAAAFYSSSLGASGAIFGIIGVLTVLRPKMAVWAFGVPMPMFIASVFWFVLDLAGVFFPSDVANMAHIFGLAAGLAIGLAFKKKYREEVAVKGRVTSDQELDRWEKEYM